MVANLLNGKDSGLLEFDKNNSAATLNRITMEGITMKGPSRPTTCAIHDNVYHGLIGMGML